jgi:hypothetical protein
VLLFLQKQKRFEGKRPDFPDGGIFVLNDGSVKIYSNNHGKEILAIGWNGVLHLYSYFLY